MNYGEMANTAENNRCSLRRIARHEEPEFSNASILNSMEKFVRTVNEMEETILVPSRLLDLSVGDAADTICQKAAAAKHVGAASAGGSNASCVSGASSAAGGSIKDSLYNTDLYRLYNIVNQMKVELLWSQENPAQALADEHQEQEAQRAKAQVVAMEHARLGHARCPSTTSMQSVQSASSLVSSSSVSSDSDSDTGIENDSGLEGEEPTTSSDRLANIAAENFRRHLRGLHRSINRMTEAAEYLTLRYQADVGGQV